MLTAKDAVRNIKGLNEADAQAWVGLARTVSARVGDEFLAARVASIVFSESAAQPLRRALDLLKIQEAIEKSHEDIRTALTSALSDERSGSDGNYYPYCYVASVFDDYFVQNEGNDYFKRAYSINDDGTATLGSDKIEVTPRSVYDEVAGDDDAPMMEACRDCDRDQVLIERSIPQATRTKIDPSDFAGKNKSFPIQKAEDVAAAAKSIGRAGDNNHSPEQLKKNITRIAKRKGFTSSLPKAWTSKTAAAKEGAIDVDFDGYIPLKERAIANDGTIGVKLIAPGWGSSGYYSAALIERDGPKLFEKGKKMYWDHATEAEEEQRPEGSLDRYAATLVENARYVADHAQGPGLYSVAKVNENFRGPVEELSENIGLSIRARGRGKAGEAEGRTGTIIESIVSAKSVDFVTEPGAGGKILQLFEAARGPKPKEKSGSMTEQEQKDLKEARDANVKTNAELTKLQTRMALTESRDYIARKLRPVTLPEITKQRLLTNLVNGTSLKEGAFDTAAMDTLIESSVKEEAAYVAALTSSGAVLGMGSIPLAEADPAADVAAKESAASLEKEFATLGLSEAGAKIAAGGRIN